MRRQPAAFMSYVRFDDQHEGGKLTQFRERLAAEVQVQTGEQFVIFQDRNDIAWGQNWKARIDETLDAMTLLIPIITPSFFRSPACREELARFLERERTLGHGDLILPVYYVSTPDLDNPKRGKAHELARILAARQYADWRDLRFEPFTSPVVGKALAQLANRMRDSFWREGKAPAAEPRPAGRTAARAPAPRAGAAKSTATRRAPAAAKHEPPTHVVDAYQRGDYPTIGAAIAAAHPGDRILVRPGLYQEGLVIDKPLELLGDGPPPDIEVQARDQEVLVFQASIGRVANLTLRQVASKGEWDAIDIGQGRLELEGCDISGGLSPVVIRDGADPRIRNNRIHDGKECGVFVHDNGLGMLEDNDITGSQSAGVDITTGGNPTLRHNQIHDNKGSGVYVYDNGVGTLEDNDITANGLHGVLITTGGNPTVRRNRINRNTPYGVRIVDKGRGVIDDNDLTDNKNGALNIAADSKPNVKSIGNRE